MTTDNAKIQCFNKQLEMALASSKFSIWHWPDLGRSWDCDVLLKNDEGVEIKIAKKAATLIEAVDAAYEAFQIHITPAFDCRLLLEHSDQPAGPPADEIPF